MENVALQYEENLDRGLKVRFFDHSVKDRYNSQLQGKDVYKKKLYIEIHNLSNPKSIPVRPATMESLLDEENNIVQASDIHRFPRQYQQYLAGVEQKDGLPIKVWAFKPDDGLVAALEKHGITTVEELAYYQKEDLNGIATFYQLKQKAIQYLKSQNDNSEINKILAENQNMQDQIDFLKSQIAEITVATNAALAKKEANQALQELSTTRNDISITPIVEEQPSTTPLSKKEFKKKETLGTQDN